MTSPLRLRTAAEVGADKIIDEIMQTPADQEEILLKKLHDLGIAGAKRVTHSLPRGTVERPAICPLSEAQEKNLHDLLLTLQGEARLRLFTVLSYLGGEKTVEALLTLPPALEENEIGGVICCLAQIGGPRAAAYLQKFKDDTTLPEKIRSWFSGADSRLKDGGWLDIGVHRSEEPESAPYDF